MNSVDLGKRERNRIAKRGNIVDVATSSFFSRGYAATTMSAIAVEIGGSKGTLWSYFTSKEHLFEAVVDTQVKALEARIQGSFSATDVSRAELRRLLLHFTEILFDDAAVSLFRLVIAEGDRFPELRSVFYERGPSKLLTHARDYFAQRFTMKQAQRLAQVTVSAVFGYRTDTLLRPEWPSRAPAEDYFDNFLDHLYLPFPGFADDR